MFCDKTSTTLPPSPFFLFNLSQQQKNQVGCFKILFASFSSFAACALSLRETLYFLSRSFCNLSSLYEVLSVHFQFIFSHLLPFLPLFFGKPRASLGLTALQVHVSGFKR
jgi:hypothetical protein